MEQVNQKSLTAKFFFLSLGALVSLIASVSAFLTLAFQVLNQRFPDALNATYMHGYNTYNFEGIRTALATLIIAFPIFIIVSYFWSKASKMNLSLGDSVIRKWMLYLVLFLSGIVLAADLVTLVRYFVSGEITTRFILKVLVTLVAAIFVGTYYFYELHGIKSRYPLPKIFALKSSAIVLALIILSFMTIGSPAKQRDLRFDQRRVDDLQSMQYGVINFWQQKGRLPVSLDEMSDPISSYMVPVDPEMQDGRVYEYAVLAEKTFELCATFSLPMPVGWQEYTDGSIRPMIGGGRDIAMSYPAGTKSDSWDHDTGRTCFSRTIDPDMYPVYEKEIRF